jgi:hypothetical protein
MAAEASETSMPWSLLAQYCAIGVDPYTVQVGRLLSDHFKLSVQGERNVSHALNNLGVYGRIDEGLSFGFGTNHIIRNPDLNVGGFVLTALCGVLLEYFDEEFTARVLGELVKLQQLACPAPMTPPLRQWKAMVHSCNGIFATARFGIVIEDFVQLNSPDFKGIPQSTHASPRSIAQALHAIGLMSSGKEKQMTVMGGQDAGWIAAIAEWLFDFKVLVQGQDGARLYTNCENLEPEVLVVFNYNMEADGSSGSMPTKGSLYLLAPGAEPGTNPGPSPSGRVEWHFLAKVFGERFAKLTADGNATTLGLAIGSAARAFEGLVVGKLETASTASDLATVRNMHSLGSYGAGLVETITTWMPGLRRYTGPMNRGVKMEFEEASACYSEQVAKLRIACGPCDICSLEDNRSTIQPRTDRKFCKLVIVETIIALGLALSKMIVAADLFPKRAGIEGFYNRQVQKRIQTKDAALTVLQHFVIVFGNELLPMNITRLEVCVEIFGGSDDAHDIRDGLVALSRAGVCAHLVVLEGASGRPGAGEEGLIRIVPGKITFQRRVYDRVSDGKTLRDSTSYHLWEAIETQNPPQQFYCN